MKLSADSHRQLEEFFREHFSDENLILPVIQIYGSRGSRLLTKILSVDGITFGRHIFITPRYLRRCQQDSGLSAPSGLLVHEITHTLQYRRHGTFKFFYLYLKGFFEALRRKEKWNFQARMLAYLEIPHEVEARNTASAFIFWREKRCSRKDYLASSSVNSK